MLATALPGTVSGKVTEAQPYGIEIPLFGIQTSIEVMEILVTINGETIFQITDFARNKAVVLIFLKHENTVKFTTTGSHMGIQAMSVSNRMKRIDSFSFSTTGV